MKCTRQLSRLLLLLLIAALPALAEKVSTLPAPTGYIDDYAGVFSSPGRSDMEDLCKEVHDKTKAQVFVVTIKTLDGEPVETFANELFAKWKIGEKKTDRGVLLLFAINDRKRWIEVGYGLEGILNDAKVGDIGRAMVPALRDAQYDEAAKTGLQSVSKIIAADAGVTLDSVADVDEEQAPVASPQPQPTPTVQGSRIPWLFVAFALMPPVLMVAMFIWRFKHGMRMGSGGYVSGGSGDSSFGSSDSSFSSSDDSFGGGDGGSSGGGGAGGDW